RLSHTRKVKKSEVEDQRGVHTASSQIAVICSGVQVHLKTASICPSIPPSIHPFSNYQTLGP
ncbi:hypothetical protein J4Q44_G00102800, partial [Coregonus suidteri]